MEPARRILLAAWADLGAGFYEWAVYKAWRAAVSALAGVYGGLGPRGRGSAAYMAAGLSGSCRPVGELWGCAARLDARAAPLVYMEVEALLGVELGYGRAQALDSVECSLRIIEGLKSCGSPGASAPISLLRRWLDTASSRLGEATIASVGGLYIIAVDAARGRPYTARVEALSDGLPPAMSLILSPEEAALLLGLPSWASEEVEFIRDDYGVEAARGKLL